MVMAEVEGRGPRGRGIGDRRVVMTSPREVIRLSMKCGREFGGGATRVGGGATRVGGGATRVGADEMEEEREMTVGRMG